jgi:hypothetical protein
LNSQNLVPQINFRTCNLTNQPGMTIQIEKIEYRFNPTRLILVLKVLACLTWVVLVAMLIGGLDSLGKQRREFMIPEEPHLLQGFKASFFLFPGHLGLFMVDLFYLVVVGILSLFFTVGTVCCFLFYAIDDTKGKERTYTRHVKVLVFLPVFQLYSHLCGNLHYQFYGAVGVIPPENVFWLFDYRSFFCGIGAIFPVTLLIALVCLVIYAFYYTLTGRLCFDRIPVDIPALKVSTLDIHALKS